MNVTTTEVNIRKFTRDIYKYLKAQGSYVVTKNTKPVYEVHITLPGKNGSTPCGGELARAVNTAFINELSPEKYACGCEKDFKHNICKKHQRY